MKRLVCLLACSLAACGTELPGETWQGTFGNAAATLTLTDLPQNEVQGELEIQASTWPVTGTSGTRTTLFILPLVDEDILFDTLEAQAAPGYRPAHAADIIRMDLRQTDQILEGSITAPFSGLQGQARFTNP